MTESIWQPVETAPTDTPVLVFDGRQIAVGRKSVYDSFRSSWWVADTYGFCEDGEIYDVSHWMPLPEPPSTKR